MGTWWIKDSRAVKPLISALKAGDLEIVAGAYSYFIELGEPGTEEILIKALNIYGTKEMALDFFNCGNDKLKNAAEKWAKEHGYQIFTMGSRGGPIWGIIREFEEY